jgi:hypothetical protein
VAKDRPRRDEGGAESGQRDATDWNTKPWRRKLNYEIVVREKEEGE